MTKLPVAIFPIAVGGTTIAALVVSVEVEAQFAIVTPPDAEVITSIRWEAAMQRGVPQLQDQPNKQLTSRPVRIDFGDGSPSVTLDMIDPSQSFTANDGVGVTVTPTGSVNAAGTGPAGSPFSDTAPAGGGVTVPDAEVVSGIAWTAG